MSASTDTSNRIYSHIILVGSTFGAGLVVSEYHQQTLTAAIKYFENHLAALKDTNRLPTGEFYQYRPDAVWGIDSITTRP